MSASCFIINYVAFLRRKYTYENRGRIVAFLLLIVIFAGTISPTVGGVLNNIKLGLDLQGGFEVLYQVEPLKDGQKITEEVVEDTAVRTY